MKTFRLLAGAALALALATAANAYPGGLDNPMITTPAPYSPPDASGTVTAGGSFQTVFSANPLRVGCFIQNPIAATETLLVHFQAGSASTSNSANLSPGGSFNCMWGGVVVTGAVQVEAATSGHAFVAAGQ